MSEGTIMKNRRVTRLGAFFAAAALSAAVLATACGSGTNAAGGDAGGSTATATATATATQTEAPSDTTVAATETAVSETPAAGSGDDAAGDLVAQGAEIFQTAGGVGCAFCHGPQGKGDGEAGNGAPNIQGADKARVQAAVSGGVPLMGFISLSSDEIAAVAAYLQSLSGQ